jgi:hypothetical protein
MTVSQPLPDNKFIRFQRARPRTFDAMLLFFFLALVYVWALGLPPVGEDFARLAGKTDAPALTQAWIAGQVTLFGGLAFLYHLSNLALLFANMLLVHHLFQRLFPETKRWLGRLAAVLFMANPAYSDGVLALTAAHDLLPVFIALIVLTAQAEACLRSKTMAGWIFYFLAAMSSAFAAVHFTVLLNLPWLLLLHECFYAKPGRITITPRVSGYALAGALAWALTGPRAFPMIPGQTFAPLYFILYPIGFLPETVRTFAERPLLGWIAAGAALAVVLLVARIANRRVVWFCIVSALLLRVGLGARAIDPVHLIGGGQLMLPGALVAIAVAAIFGRMLEHPKWPRNVVVLSSLLALLLMALQIRTIAAWRVAGRVVTEFQAATAASPTTDGGEALTIGVLPDYTAYRGAPIQLSASVTHDTPFSRAHPHVPLLRLAYDHPQRLSVNARYADNRWQVQIEHPNLTSLIPVSYDAVDPRTLLAPPEVEAEITSSESNKLQLTIEPSVEIENILPAIERVP